jgi:hypothetical protein
LYVQYIDCGIEGLLRSIVVLKLDDALVVFLFLVLLVEQLELLDTVEPFLGKARLGWGWGWGWAGWTRHGLGTENEGNE